MGEVGIWFFCRCLGMRFIVMDVMIREIVWMCVYYIVYVCVNYVEYMCVYCVVVILYFVCSIKSMCVCYRYIDDER